MRYPFRPESLPPYPGGHMKARDFLKSAGGAVAGRILAGLETVEARASGIAIIQKSRLIAGLSLLLFSQQAFASQIAGDSGAVQAPAPTTALPACGEELLSSPGALTTQVGSGPEPGATDPLGVPAGRYQLFPDDGILAYRPGETITAGYYITDTAPVLGLDNNQTLQSSPWDPYGDGPVPIFATAGRILHPDKDSVVTATRLGYASSGPASVQVKFLDGGSTVLPDRLLRRQNDSTDFIAIAHGDLDNALGADGNLHDEVVVARVTTEDNHPTKRYFGYRLDVLNYGKGDSSAPEDTYATFTDLGPIFNPSPSNTADNSGLLPSDNILSIGIGDFEGDGKKEIALAALSDGKLLLYTYRYDTVNDKHTLTQVKSQSFGMQGGVLSGYLGGLPLVGTISAVAGDFDGDGADELAIAYAKWGPAESNKSAGGYAVGVMLFKYNANFEATPKSTNRLFAIGGVPANGGSYPVASRPRVELVSGQFLLDPPRIPYGTKQLVLGWHDTDTAAGGISRTLGTVVVAFSVSSDLTTLSNIGINQRFKPNLAGTNGIYQFALAAGGFEGASGSLPVASLALSYWAGDPGSTSAISYWSIHAFRITGNGISEVTSRQGQQNKPLDLRGRFPLIAYDRPGNSRYLGAPVHLTVLNAPSTDYIMQEPPKHVYWDEATHRVVNLTRFDGNNVHLYNSASASMSTESKDQSARATGGSLSISAGRTVTAGSDWGIGKASFETSRDVQLRAGYDYDEHKEAYNSGYQSRTIESTAETDRDDFIKGKEQTIDIWRYRIYGTPTGGPTNAFYEIVLPGLEREFRVGGLTSSWYEPIHENGNILSYPARLGASADPYIPSDIGSYKLQDGTIKTGSPQVPAQKNYFDGTGSSTALRFANEVGQGTSFTYNHGIAESLDIKTSFTSSTSVLSAGVNVRVCGSIEAHNSNSWGGAQTSTETTRDETAVILNRAPGRVNVSYPFYPVIYNTLDGTMKMSFAVPNPADPSNRSGYQTYAELYGGLPDPALNLPLRLVPNPAGSGELEQWTANEKIGRKSMRGLFFREPDINPAAKTFLLLGFYPQDGQTVRIEPRIYNYSTAQPAIGTVVEFQVIPYDASVDSEVCEDPLNKAEGVTTGLVCPRSARRIIGRTIVPRLEPLQFTCAAGYDIPANTGCAPSVFLNWNTAGFGPALGTNEYRVYVVLNPDQPAGSEKYAIEPDPISVTNVSNTTPMVVTAPGNTLNTGDYVIIGGVRGLNAANGTFRVTRVSDDEFSLDGTSNSRGAYTGGGTAALLDPGQNNEGYGVIGVTRMPELASAREEDRIPRDYLGEDGLEGLSEETVPKLRQSDLTAIQNVPLELRFTAHSSMIHTEAAHMLLYDGDPASGAPAISDQIIHPGSHGPEGTSIWIDWTPTTTGDHQLYAVLLEGSRKEQAMAELKVKVVAKLPSSGATR